MRIKRGTTHLKRRRSLLNKTKGYLWGRKSKIKQARIAVTKAGAHAFRDRRSKKRAFRKLWQLRINSAARQHGLPYSKFMDGINKSKIGLDRKVLADLAMNHPKIFEAIVKEVQK
ncbi:MAG: 50S ribosomal protein L20 [Patescibacteria group bacterium]|nr:50S ribosomal protein L20 [Patescibacteria group bacterium]MDD5566802.1 50S ribosomal protein L20 [Patescibacteria group bacterium]